MTRQSALTRTVEVLGRLSSKVLARRQQRYNEYRSNPLNEDQHYPAVRALQWQPVHIDEVVQVPSGDAVFLLLGLRANGWGYLRDPYVTLTTPDGRSIKQYLERGVNAKRYINATPLAGCSVIVTLSDVALTSRDASWLTSPSQPLPAPLLVVAPHPDDAELSSFGLYSSRPSWIVTASAGEVGSHNYGGLFPDDEHGALLRGQTRVTESLSAPQAGGVPEERCANLGYFDGTLAEMHADQSLNARSQRAGIGDLAQFRRAGTHLALPHRDRATWDALVSDIEHVLRVSNAATIAFPHPMLDHHPDHACVGLASIQALLRIEKPLTVLSYVVHGPGGANGANIHPVGMRDGVVSLPPGFHTTPLFDGIVSVSLTAEQLRRKVVALDTYRDLKDPNGPLPQEDAWLRAKAGLREIYRAGMVYDVGLLRRFVRPTEIFYRFDHERLRHWHDVFEAAVIESTR